MQHARDLVVNHLGCDIRDVRKFVFYPKNDVNFMAEIYIFPFIDCLLLLFNVFYHRSDREIPTAAAFAAVLTCRRVALWTSRTEAVVYVVRRRSL